MPPPVVALTRPAASPTASTRVGVGAWDGREREHLLARRQRRTVRSSRVDAPARRDVARQAAEEVASLAVTHQADARVRAGGPHDRDRPGEAAGRHVPAEPHFDVAQTSGRQFHLGRLKEHRRQAHAEPSLDRVLRAARQHAGATPDERAVVERDGDPVCAPPWRPTPVDPVTMVAPARRAASNSPRSRASRSTTTASVSAVVCSTVAPRRREEPGRAERVEDDVAGEAELIEGFDGKHARAVHGVAAGGVLFVERRHRSRRSQQTGRFEARQGRRR